MELKYVGPHAEGVDIRIGGRWRTVRPGETVEVADDQGALLAEQATNWHPVKPPRRAAETREAE